MKILDPVWLIIYATCFFLLLLYAALVAAYLRETWRERPRKEKTIQLREVKPGKYKI